MIALLITFSGLTLGIQEIRIGDFQRGSDTPLGLSLGLDLQGGSHLVYQAALTDPDTGQRSEVTESQMLSLQMTIERRINASGLGEPIIQVLGDDRLLIQLPGVRDPGRAKNIIGETARLEFKHRVNNVPRTIEHITDADIVSVTAARITQSGILASKPLQQDATVPSTSTKNQQEEVDFPALIIEFTDLGVLKFNDLAMRLAVSFAESMSGIQKGEFRPPDRLQIDSEGADTLRFEVLGNQLQQLGTSTSYAISLPTGNDGTEHIDVETAKAQLGSNPSLSFTQVLGIVDEHIGLTGDDLANAYPSQHQASGVPIVSIEFNDEGTRVFGELTQSIVEKQERTGQRDQIAIFLDDQELIAPVVQSTITAGTAIIQGPEFTLERVRDLSLLLESGRLPIPIELIQERDVDAILGADSLRRSLVAGGAGLLLVLLFMTLYYRVPGLIAALALIIYSAIVLSIFKILPVTLTLSGVAAAILSMGMAVDANILIFERMKDELRTGRTLLSSINIGFNRAWPAIRDGNVSTLITCGILFWFSDQLGATIVQGFAVTLAIGVTVSMFSAIVVSRSFMRVLASTPIARNLGWFSPTGKTDLPQSTTNSTV